MKIFELLSENRIKGKSLKDLGVDEIYVIIFRAVISTTTEINKMDYVTRNKKFAIEHADHIAAVEGEPAHVLRAMVKAEDVYEAYNPGEYFYDGPPPKNIKIFYTT